MFLLYICIYSVFFPWIYLFSYCILQELAEKNVECRKLQESRKKVESEIEDLTASLFEEANKMVYDANVKREKAEKRFAEAQGNVCVYFANCSDSLLYTFALL